jgi:four helix bundle protein
MVIQSFRDIIAWQKSHELTLKVCDLTSRFPKHELFGLVSQMRRCSVSVPSNIAEG